MKKITFLFLFAFAFIYQVNAQCTNTTLYPDDPINALNDGYFHVIDDCNYSGEYSILEGLTIADNYELSNTLNDVHGYVTVIDAADGTTVLAHGASPLLYIPTVANVQLHWNFDNTCTADTDCHDTGYIDLSIVPVPIPDECADAIALNCGDTVTGTTSLATDSGGNSNLAEDVWYSYTGTGTAEDITVSLCNSAYDTAIRVYTDCSLTAGAQVLFNDDADTCELYSIQSYGAFASDGTTTYYILVEGYGSSDGDYELTLTCAANVPPPINDLCADAVALSLGVTTAGTTAGATDSSTGNIDDTTCDSFSFKSDVWYTFVAPDADVSIVSTITGNSDQANIAVYDTNNSVDCSQLDNDSIACEFGGGGESFDVTGLTVDNIYYIRVWSDGVALRQSSEARIEGTFTITVNDAVLSTMEFENANAFTYFPNPVKNELNLRAQSTIQNVSIYNMLGQEVLRTVPNAMESDINMNELQSGAYFVKVTINDVTETVRVIKQ